VRSAPAAAQTLAAAGAPPNASVAASRDLGRQALRRIASGVTVLTVNRDGVRHGVTVSAIIPISRDPLVLGASLRARSAFAAMASDCRRFSVNVLSRAQVAVADRFAAPDRPAGDAQFAELAWTTDGITGAPLIGGCLAHLACRVIDLRAVGDHDLVIAEVLGGVPGEGAPLLTFAGRLDRGGEGGHRTGTPAAQPTTTPERPRRGAEQP
jgi:flavin reductase (DIM6/NTAB) family NADH-FMN oxidoreductase RutF